MRGIMIRLMQSLADAAPAAYGSNLHRISRPAFPPVAFEKFEICTLIPLSSSFFVGSIELHTPRDSQKSFASQLR
jgi:hypothetical protein